MNVGDALMLVVLVVGFGTAALLLSLALYSEKVMREAEDSDEDGPF